MDFYTELAKMKTNLFKSEIVFRCKYCHARENSLSKCLETFLETCHQFFLYPYAFTPNSPVLSLVHRIIVTLFYASGTASFLSNLWPSIRSFEPNCPTSYFSFGIVAASFAARVLHFKLFWLNDILYKEIIEFIDTVPFKSISSACKWFKIVVISGFTFYTLSGVRLYMEYDRSPSGVPYLDIVLCVGRILCEQITGFCELVLFAFCLTLNQAVKSFVRCLKGNTENSWDGIQNHFDKLRELSRMINKAIGNFAGLYMFQSLLFYATRLDTMMMGNGVQSMSPFSAVELLIYSVTTVVVLFLASDTANQMQIFKDWLSERKNYENIRSVDLGIVLNHIDSNSVAIKAYSIFPITYGLLASVSFHNNNCCQDRYF